MSLKLTNKRRLTAIIKLGVDQISNLNDISTDIHHFH